MSDDPVGVVSERYLSFTVDIGQVVGGKFWGAEGNVDKVVGGSSPVPPYDFTRPRLIKLVQNLAPAYLRIGGSASDEVYYDMGDSIPTPPAPYKYRLNRGQWDALNHFAGEAGLQVVFALNAGQGPRDGAGRWLPDNARQLIQYSAEQGYPIAAWSLGNEPNLFPIAHGLWLSTRQYAQEYKVLKAILREWMPAARLLGPSSAFWPVIGEMLPVFPNFMKEAGELLDVVTWHYYPQQSSRSPVAVRRASPQWMLSPAFFDETSRWASQITRLRDRFAPQEEIWLEESGNAQCGGEPGLSDRFIAGFWWLDTLGLLARAGQHIVTRQNLSGADYSLLNETKLDPNPDYWNSYLWKQLMGTTVLDVKYSPQRPDLRLYAHSSRDQAPPTKVVLALNINQQESLELDFGTSPLQVYLCTADDLLDRQVLLNGQPLETGTDGSAPELQPVTVTDSPVLLPPVSYTFIVIPNPKT
jgi:heparanase 1